jgi:uncharacterized protein
VGDWLVVDEGSDRGFGRVRDADAALEALAEFAGTELGRKYPQSVKVFEDARDRVPGKCQRSMPGWRSFMGSTRRCSPSGRSHHRRTPRRITIMLTTDYVPGAPVWVDLGTPDIEAAASFYGALFGWQFRSAGPDAGGYGMFVLDGKTVAAAGPLTEVGASSAWTLYFHALDADATAKAVEQAGGTVRFAPMDVFTNGRMAGFTDPFGAQFAAWQPRETKGLDTVTAPNTLCWTELYTTDQAAAKSFYGSVFGWEAEDVPMGEFTYTVVRPSGGGEEASQGGIMGLDAEMLGAGVTPHWQPYFEVADCDAVVATATGRGGTVHMGPADLEGVGRLAILTDPFGASFALITSVTA